MKTMNSYTRIQCQGTAQGKRLRLPQVPLLALLVGALKVRVRPDLKAKQLRRRHWQASIVTHLVGSRSGRAGQLCPGSSDVDFLRNFDGVIYLDTEVANGALDLGVSEKQLNGA
jgi:hypothetical protein